jgi:hypothetical protein
MSKVVNWGHWIVAIVFALGRLGLLISDAGSFFRGIRSAFHGEAVSFYSLYLDLLWTAAVLVCAWGILKWRLWGHYLALFFAIVAAIAGAFLSYLGRGSSSEPAMISAAVAALLITAWLLLPAVRRQYVQRSLAI